MVWPPVIHQDVEDEVTRIATRTTMLQERGEWVDDPDGPGGAAPTGTTDASSVFQTKIDALNAVGGGTLFIPQNRYTVNMLRTYEHIRFQGMGNKQYGFSGGSGGRASVMCLPTSAPSAQLISMIHVTAGGTGYTTAPTVSFTGGGGTGATATAWVSGGVVVAVEVVDPGSGYTSVPGVVLTPTSGGTGAAATAIRSFPIIYSRDAIPFHTEIDGLVLTGSDTVGGIGLLLHNAWAWKISDSHFYAFNREAILNWEGAGGAISDCKIFGCSRTGSGLLFKTGALRTRGSDIQMNNLEIGADDSTDSTGLWNAAWMHEGSSAQVVNVICEGADTGLLLTGSRNEFVNLRTDINYGHGVWMTRTNISREPPHRNIFASIKSHNNSRYTNNTFDAFHIDAGHTIDGNIIVALRSESTGGGTFPNAHRYGFYDGPNNTISDTRAFHHHLGYAGTGTTAGFFAGPGG